MPPSAAFPHSDSELPIGDEERKIERPHGRGRGNRRDEEDGRKTGGRGGRKGGREEAAGKGLGAHGAARQGHADTAAVIFSVSPPRHQVHGISHQRQKRNIRGALGERGRASSQVEARACALWKTGAPRGRCPEAARERPPYIRANARAREHTHTHTHTHAHTHTHTHIIRLRGHHLLCSHLRNGTSPRGHMLVPTCLYFL